MIDWDHVSQPDGEENGLGAELTLLEKTLRRYLQDTSGATAIEYGLIAALIGVALITGARSVGSSITSLFGNNDAEINTALNG